MKSAGNYAFHVRSRQGLQNPVRWPTADEIADMADSRAFGAASPGQTPPTMTSKAQLNDKSRAELEALQELPDDRIDTNDIPEVLDWTGACRGVFNRSVKQQVPRRQHGKEL